MTSDVVPPPVRADRSAPLWQQVVALIDAEIVSGSLSEGSRLPAERELCERLGVSRVTLRRGLAELVDRGKLTSSQGRGWFVSTRQESHEWPSVLESFTATAERMGLVPRSRVLRAASDAATFDEATGLGIAPGTPVIRLDRVRLFDAVPIAVEVTVLPLTVMPDALAIDFSTASLYAELARAGSQPDRSEATIEAAIATTDLARLLAVEEGSAVLAMRQMVYDAQSRPLCTTVLTYAGDRYRLHARFARAAR